MLIIYEFPAHRMESTYHSIKILLTSLNCPTAQIKLQSCQPVRYFSDIIFVSAHIFCEILYAMRYFIKSGYSLRRLMTFNYLRLEDKKKQKYFSSDYEVE